MNDLIGKKVVVYSNAGGVEKQEIGTLESADSTWVKLRKTSTELLIFSVYNIRMVKPFES